MFGFFFNEIKHFYHVIQQLHSLILPKGVGKYVHKKPTHEYL